MRETPDQPLRHRKARDRAMILPLVGSVLMLPPFAGIFDVDARIAGVPVALVYVGSVWIGLILAGAALAPGLHDGDEATAGEPTPPDPGGPG